MTAKFRTTRRAALAGASALALAGGRARAADTDNDTDAEEGRHAHLHAEQRAADPGGADHGGDAGAHRQRQGHRRPAGIRLRHQAPAAARDRMVDQPGRQDLHLQAPAEREVPRRQALHLGRRRLFDPAPEDGPSARPQHLRQRHRGQDARSADGRLRALQARALPDQGADGGRGADDAAPHLRGHRSAGQSQRQCADRHRPLQVQGMGARQPHHLRAQSRLLGCAQALHRPHGLQVPARSGRALDRLRERLGRHRLSHAGGAVRPRAAEEDADLCASRPTARATRTMSRLCSSISTASSSRS